MPLRCGLTVLAAVAYALAFPPLGWRWLIVPGIAGLLWALQGLRGSAARGVGFLHGMVAYGVGLPWLWLLFGPFAIALWGILAGFTAAFAWMQSRAEARGWMGWWMVIFTLVNWFAWEFIRAELFPLKFPWMTPGLAWGPNWLLPFVGVYVAGLLLVLIAACAVQRRWLAVGVSMLLAWALSATYVPSASSEDGADQIEVAGLQFEEVSLKQYLDATRALPSSLQYAVWPEYAIPYDIRGNEGEWTALKNLCSERGITLTLGTQTRPKGGTEWFNTALTLDAAGVLGEHYKVHTVHFFDDGTPGIAANPVVTRMERLAPLYASIATMKALSAK